MVPAVLVMAGAGTLAVVRPRHPSIGWARVADLVLVVTGLLTLRGVGPVPHAVCATLLLALAGLVVASPRGPWPREVVVGRVSAALGIAMSAELVLLLALTGPGHAGTTAVIACVVAASDTVLVAAAFVGGIGPGRTPGVRRTVEGVAMLGIAWALVGVLT